MKKHPQFEFFEKLFIHDRFDGFDGFEDTFKGGTKERHTENIKLRYVTGQKTHRAIGHLNLVGGRNFYSIHRLVWQLAGDVEVELEFFTGSTVNVGNHVTVFFYHPVICREIGEKFPLRCLGHGTV